MNPKKRDKTIIDKAQLIVNRIIRVWATFMNRRPTTYNHRETMKADIPIQRFIMRLDKYAPNAPVQFCISFPMEESSPTDRFSTLLWSMLPVKKNEMKEIVK